MLIGTIWHTCKPFPTIFTESSALFFHQLSLSHPITSQRFLGCYAVLFVFVLLFLALSVFFLLISTRIITSWYHWKTISPPQYGQSTEILATIVHLSRRTRVKRKLFTITSLSQQNNIVKYEWWTHKFLWTHQFNIHLFIHSFISSLCQCMKFCTK